MIFLTEHALVVFAIWLVWTVAEIWLVGPKWSWYLSAAVLGVGAQLLLDPSDWWLGLGLAGAAAILVSLTDLLLVATDALKVSVLRSNRK